MNKTLLIKYISGQADPHESAAVLAWVGENEENKKYFIRMQNLWISQNMPNEEASDSEVAGMMSMVRSGRRRHVSISKGGIWAIAACFLVLMVSGVYLTWSYMKPEPPVAYAPFDYGTHKILYTDKGVKGRVILPDSSVVWLNSDSRLHYPDQFEGKTREVALSGEAYFEVRHQPERPMIVNTNKGFKIEVLGTTFNLKSYDNDDRSEATLYSGSINLIMDGRDGGQPVTRMINPNETVVIDRKLTSSVKNLPDPTVNYAWKEGKIHFDGTPIPEVVKMLERWHGVDFEITDKDILDHKFTGNFESESIVQIMDLMRLTSFIDYEIAGKTVTLRKR